MTSKQNQTLKQIYSLKQIPKLMLIQALVSMLKEKLVPTLALTQEFKLKLRLISRPSLMHASKRFPILVIQLILILKANVTLSMLLLAATKTPTSDPFALFQFWWCVCMR